jgi:hypothetical protein
MNLKDFVSESLVQIVSGVAQAQEQLHGTRARVNPQMFTTTDKNSIGQAHGSDSDQPVYNVEFDVVVSAAEGTGTKGGIGVAVGFIGLGSQGQSEAKSGHESRIKFKVPLLLPTHKSDAT